jgi:iron complex transport system ATP-binding protein
MRPLLELIDLVFSYGDRSVVSGVSLGLPPGRFLGLLGPNGSGKSTLVRLAAGLLSPRRGEVRLDGRELRSFSRGDIARRIAVVPQGATLPEAFSGREIVLLGRTPHLGWLASESPLDEAIAQRALEMVGAADFADRRVGELSGGERQRLVLARALAQEPDVLLLDEPTTHLDLTHQLAILDLVRSLARTDKLAVLGVFHDLNLAAEYCDEVAVLDSGRLVARGTPEMTLTTDLVHRVYGVDVVIARHPSSGRPVILPAAANRATPTAVLGWRHDAHA